MASAGDSSTTGRGGGLVANDPRTATTAPGRGAVDGGTRPGPGRAGPAAAVVAPGAGAVHFLAGALRPHGGGAHLQLRRGDDVRADREPGRARQRRDPDLLGLPDPAGDAAARRDQLLAVRAGAVAGGDPVLRGGADRGGGRSGGALVRDAVRGVAAERGRHGGDRGAALPVRARPGVRGAPGAGDGAAVRGRDAGVAARQDVLLGAVDDAAAARRGLLLVAA